MRDDVERLKEIVRSPDFARGVMAKIEEEDARWQAEARRMIETHFPHHAGHNPGELVEGEWEYFDAMFVSYEIKCGCGDVLVVSREMLEGRW